ncbi:AAA family ATPase [Conexibacter sp. SYSU D00693]|uniref:AAA family ATPase n=1 Tax=Conexibacter sp. SYSU D00693 TaxID=2812560 RepID=UPI00196B94BF|nr:AAA family ATPase [Conexibacter sp. SYSU D00693]
MQADRDALAREWRRLGRAATVVALLTSPATFTVFHSVNDLPLWLSVVLTLLFIGAFRGLVDMLCHRLIPRPSLYGADERLKAEDVVFRRRRWYWRTRFKRLLWLAFFVVLGLAVLQLVLRGLLGTDTPFFKPGEALDELFPERTDRVTLLTSQLMLFVQLPLLFFANFMIFFGPLLLFGVLQMKAFEPGDADWGVKLEDVRGQAEPKEDVKRVITLWSAGEEFKKAGGKPERGLLLIGAPGTGKTMLSKAIATSFNSPIMTMPGSGFAQTFIGLDVVMVMILVARARRLARKWGGTCMVFIDEIDAVGRRRQALGGMVGHAPAPTTAQDVEDHLFFGDWGAFSASGDLVLETRAWRERLFAQRVEAPSSAHPVVERINRFMFPGMGGGMALNQLLVQMDGMDNPPILRKWVTKKFNTFLDALYIVPQRIGGASLRLAPPQPRSEQVYFIGATNVPLDALDPALIRPGRMGRHIYFRTPTQEDRKDVFDLYLGRVAHEEELDTPKRRDELARITGGYSPAMIEQVCSMALTYAHADDRAVFGWKDLIEAMTTIESGTAIGVDYVAEETRAVAIHEAGHAVASHVYMDGVLSTRLSIRMRGGSLGHHQAIEKEERFSAWRHEDVGRLVWTLGAMAAEHVFYGENSRGVGGDVQSATTLAALMVGFWGMGPEPVTLDHVEFTDEEVRKEAVEDYEERFERIGLRIMNRAASGSPMEGNPIASILGDPSKKKAAARILGQAYLTAFCLVRHNREQVARIADTLIERKEMHGDEVVELLEAARLEAPAIDITDETIWKTAAAA